MLFWSNFAEVDKLSNLLLSENIPKVFLNLLDVFVIVSKLDITRNKREKPCFSI